MYIGFMSGAGRIQFNLPFCGVAPNRLGKIIRFNAQALAVLEANTTTLQRIATKSVDRQSCMLYSHPPLNDTPPPFDTLLYTL